MYEFPPQFPFIIRARVCRGCLSSVLFWGRRILFVPGEGYVGYIEQGSGWTWLGFIFRNLRDLIIRQWYILSNFLKRISRRCLSVPLADCIFVKLCGDMRGHVVLWSLSLFVLQRQDRPLNIFPPRQETGCEALFYGWRASTFYPESPSLNVLRSCNECWSSSNDWTEMVERLCSKVVQGCVQRGWQGWNEQFPFRQEEFRNQCSAKRELFTLQTCSLREST